MGDRLATIDMGREVGSRPAVPFPFGLRRFRYMTVSVQRGGHFRYMTTSVHMRSISVHVFFVVRLPYMRSTISVHYYVDIGRPYR